jgi:hypothetical protein
MADAGRSAYLIEAAEKPANAIDSAGPVDFGCEQWGGCLRQTTDISLDTVKGVMS